MSRAKLYAFAALTAAGAGSVAVMLLVSVTRSFLPGIVELGAAFGVATIFLVASLIWSHSLGRLLRWIDGLSPRTLWAAAAGVAVLALTAGLSVPFKQFPWPVTLLVGALIIIVGGAGSGQTEPAGGDGGKGEDVPVPAVPAAPASVPVSLRRGRTWMPVKQTYVRLYSCKDAPRTVRAYALRSRRAARRPQRDPALFRTSV